MTACVKGIIEKYETLFISLMTVKSFKFQATIDASAIKHSIVQQYVNKDNLLGEQYKHYYVRSHCL